MKSSVILNEFLTNQEVIGNTKETITYYKKRIGYFISYIHDKDINNVTIEDYNLYVLNLKNKITAKTFIIQYKP